MIIYRKYGKTVEITKTQKEPSKSIRRVSNTRKSGLPLKCRRADSVRRTRRICLRKLLSTFEAYGSPLFVTLTFSGDASDVLLSSRRLSYFQKRLRVEFPDSSSLFVPELSPRGRIHYHGLVFGVSQEWGNVKKGRRIIRNGREMSERKFAQAWQSGFVDVLSTDGSPRLAYYLVKYLAKAVEEPFFTPIRLIRCSGNILDALVIRSDEGGVAEMLYQKYNKMKPVFKADFYTPFLGNIEKSFFEVDY